MNITINDEYTNFKVMGNVIRCETCGWTIELLNGNSLFHYNLQCEVHLQKHNREY